MLTKQIIGEVKKDNVLGLRDVILAARKKFDGSVNTRRF